jgi:hypothetical protein
LAWLGTAIVSVLLLFLAGISAFMITQAARMPVSLPSKLFIVSLGVGGIGFCVSTFMWGRYWRHVGWDTRFGAFTSGPEPEYEDAKMAWRWGRRARVFWIVVMISTFAVPLVETLFGNG